MGLGKNSWSKFLELGELMKGDRKNCLKVESVSKQIPSNPYASKDYFSSKYCHCNKEFFIVKLESPKLWCTGILCDLSAQFVLTWELVLFASPDCLGPVIPHPRKRERK